LNFGNFGWWSGWPVKPLLLRLKRLVDPVTVSHRHNTFFNLIYFIKFIFFLSQDSLIYRPPSLLSCSLPAFSLAHSLFLLSSPTWPLVPCVYYALFHHTISCKSPTNAHLRGSFQRRTTITDSLQKLEAILILALKRRFVVACAFRNFEPPSC
jgi:hypothetical protein